MQIYLQVAEGEIGDLAIIFNLPNMNGLKENNKWFCYTTGSCFDFNSLKTGDP